MQKHSSFKPAWWLNNNHLQTIYPALCRRIAPPTPLRRERLTTPDRDFVDIDWVGEDNAAPLVMLLHGLTGSSRSGYIAGLQNALRAHGVRSVALNFRGCSGEPNRLARGYHSGDTGDIDFLYRQLRQREPDTPMAAVGFSLGGNVLLKWLGEQGEDIDLLAAVAVSVPLVLSTCATTLDHGVARLYRDRLIRDLIDYIRNKHRYLQRVGNQQEAEKISRLGDLSRIRSFWQYDDLVVARLHGFENVQHYYRASSSRQFLNYIDTPTLLIQARDDPFMNPNVLPENRELSSCVTLEVSERGGHVGFLSGQNPLKPEYWLEHRITGFILDLMRQTNANPALCTSQRFSVPPTSPDASGDASRPP